MWLAVVWLETFFILSIVCPLYVHCVHLSAAFCMVHCALDLARDHSSYAIEMSIIIIITMGKISDQIYIYYTIYIIRCHCVSLVNSSSDCILLDCCIHFE